MDVKNFTEECILKEDCIKCTIIKLSEHEKIKLRANLKQKIVNCDKGTILISMISFAISLLSLINSINESNINFCLIYFFMAVVVACIMYVCVQMWNKSMYAKALSYLDDYFDCKKEF